MRQSSQGPAQLAAEAKASGRKLTVAAHTADADDFGEWEDDGDDVPPGLTPRVPRAPSPAVDVAPRERRPLSHVPIFFARAGAECWQGQLPLAVRSPGLTPNFVFRPARTRRSPTA